MPNTVKTSEGNAVKREEQSMVSTTAYVYRISKFFQEEGKNQTISSGNEATKKLLEKLKVENPGKGVFLFKGIADASERGNAMKAYNAFGKWYQNASVEDRKKALAAIAYYNSLHSSNGTLSFYTRKKILKAMENSMNKVGSFDINKFYSNLGLTGLNGSLSNEVQLFMKQYDKFLNEKLNNVKQDLLLNEEEQTKPNESASENPLKDQALEKVNEPLEESKETPLNVREIRKRNVKKEIFGDDNKEFKSNLIEASFNSLFDKSKDIKITRDLMKMFVESDEMKKMTKKFAEFEDEQLKNQEFKIHILGEGPFNREESKIVTGEEYKHALDRLLEIANQNESLFSEKLEDGKLWDHVMEPILAFDEEKIKKGDSKTLMKGLESSVIVSKLNGDNKLIKKYEDLFKAYSREGRVDYTALERAIKQVKGNYSNIDINNAERFMDEVIKAKSSQLVESNVASASEGDSRQILDSDNSLRDVKDQKNVDNPPNSVSKLGQGDKDNVGKTIKVQNSAEFQVKSSSLEEEEGGIRYRWNIQLSSGKNVEVILNLINNSAAGFIISYLQNLENNNKEEFNRAAEKLLGKYYYKNQFNQQRLDVDLNELNKFIEGISNDEIKKGKTLFDKLVK